MDAMRPLLGIARPGLKFVVPALAVSLCLSFVLPVWASVLLWVLSGYLVLFFRDPERRTPGIPNSVCCPADGKVVSVLEVPCEKMADGKALRVAIFLNVFNVHVQRVPVSGSVLSVERRPGRCMNALNEKCSEENEAVTVWLRSGEDTFGVRQISGAIARRILCFAEPGMEVERGSRYGIIQFGSRVELFLPLSATVKVQPGQKVVGGETCIAVLFEEEVRRGLSREKTARLPVVAA